MTWADAEACIVLKKNSHSEVYERLGFRCPLDPCVEQLIVERVVKVNGPFLTAPVVSGLGSHGNEDCPFMFSR
jgi:hypothetical protein